MKKLVLFCCICAFLSCKKKTEISDKKLVEKKWVLTTATVTPAMTLNGVTSTDYKNIHGSGSCLSNNYTLNFFDEGWYAFSSNGALCDMVPPSKEDRWRREGEVISLKSRTGKETILRFTGETITFTEIFSAGSPAVTYNLVYIFKAK